MQCSIITILADVIPLIPKQRHHAYQLENVENFVVCLRLGLNIVAYTQSAGFANENIHLQHFAVSFWIFFSQTSNVFGTKHSVTIALAMLWD